jgi:hypothetical protein
VVSPFGGIGGTAALVFVLVVAAVKAIWEDVKRHQEDTRMNTSVAHRLAPDGERAGHGGGSPESRPAPAPHTDANATPRPADPRQLH